MATVQNPRCPSCSRRLTLHKEALAWLCETPGCQLQTRVVYVKVEDAPAQGPTLFGPDGNLFGKS